MENQEIDNNQQLRNRIQEAVQEYIAAEGGAPMMDIRTIIDTALRKLRVTGIAPPASEACPEVP